MLKSSRLVVPIAGSLKSALFSSLPVVGLDFATLLAFVPIPNSHALQHLVFPFQFSSVPLPLWLLALVVSFKRVHVQLVVVLPPNNTLHYLHLSKSVIDREISWITRLACNLQEQSAP